MLCNQEFLEKGKGFFDCRKPLGSPGGVKHNLRICESFDDNIHVITQTTVNNR